MIAVLYGISYCPDNRESDNDHDGTLICTFIWGVKNDVGIVNLMDVIYCMFTKHHNECNHA